MFHVLCLLGWQRFTVQSVNGIILLLVQMVGALTIGNVCHAGERYVGVCRWGA